MFLPFLFSPFTLKTHLGHFPLRSAFDEDDLIYLVYKGMIFTTAKSLTCLGNVDKIFTSNFVS